MRVAAITAADGTHLTPVPSGDRSANPATCGVFQGASIPSEHASKFFPRAKTLATPSGSLEQLVWLIPGGGPFPGRRTSHSDYTRGQSPETGSLSRLFGSMGNDCQMCLSGSCTL